MKAHPRLTGLCLLLISMGFFLTIDLDKGGDVLGLCGFLLCFVSGWLVLIFFWNDGDITKLRRIHKEKTQGRAFQAMPVQERTFRYPAMRGVRLAVMRCLCIFMLAMAMASLYLLIFNESRADAAAMETLYFVFGLFSCSSDSTARESLRPLILVCDMPVGRILLHFEIGFLLEAGAL
jgi:Ca2+/Na+ antiporter